MLNRTYKLVTIFRDLARQARPARETPMSRRSKHEKHEATPREARRARETRTRKTLVGAAGLSGPVFVDIVEAGIKGVGYFFPNHFEITNSSRSVWVVKGA